MLLASCAMFLLSSCGGNDNALGTKSLDLGEDTTDFTQVVLYEYMNITSEEGGALNANSAEWSTGNGAVGFIGIPVDTGWEAVAMYFNADTYAANATVQVDLMNYGNVASNAAANTIASINMANSTDGGGTTNNAYKYDEFATPVPIPVTGNSTVLGFVTRGVTGNISDVRVGVRLRREIGTYFLHE